MRESEKVMGPKNFTFHVVLYIVKCTCYVEKIGVFSTSYGRCTNTYIIETGARHADSRIAVSHVQHYSLQMIHKRNTTRKMWLECNTAGAIEGVRKSHGTQNFTFHVVLYIVKCTCFVEKIGVFSTSYGLCTDTYIIETDARHADSRIAVSHVQHYSLQMIHKRNTTRKMWLGCNTAGAIEGVRKSPGAQKLDFSRGAIHFKMYMLRRKDWSI